MATTGQKQTAKEVSVADRNKTEVTLRVTEAAAGWLHGIGAKAVETEVPVARKWVADLAAFWSPTVTEALQAKLVLKQPKWNPKFDANMQLVIDLKKDAEYKQARSIWETQFNDLPPIITIVHEVKTSVNDFKNDDKWDRAPVADLQVLSYLRGCVTVIPENWWGLEHASTGKLIAVKYRSPLNKIDDSQRLQIVSQIAERRHNRTANEFFRELQKKQVIEDGDRRRSSRISDCMRAVLSILKGEHGSAEQCLKYHFNFNTKFPAYIVENLQKHYGKLPDIADE